MSTAATDEAKERAMQDALRPVYSTPEDVKAALLEVCREAERQGFNSFETQLTLIGVHRKGTGGKPPRSMA